MAGRAQNKRPPSAAQILLAVQVPVSEAGTIFRRRSPAATGRFAMNAVNIQIVTANLQDFKVSNEDNIVPVGFTLPCRWEQCCTGQMMGDVAGAAVVAARRFSRVGFRCFQTTLVDSGYPR